MRRRRQSGQAIILTIVAVGILLMGAMGLAIDAGQLYGQRQMAQAAADAAAEAAILSVYGGTNKINNNNFGSATLTCVNGTDTNAPCAYARLNGFGATASSTDTVVVDFPTSVPGVVLTTEFTPAAAHALVTRQVSTTLMRMLGAPANMTIRAAGTAAITKVTAAVPIIVTHPTLSQSLDMQGNPLIKICGGPQQSIQVNSINATAAHAGGASQIDLSKGGPLDTAGNCSSGTGTDLGVFGGPSTFPALTPLGSTTHYYQPNPPIADPLSGVSAPAKPGAAPAPTPLANGVSGCPASPKKACNLYSPGYYSSGINVKGETAVLTPGVYYMDGSDGFSNGANGEVYMCTTCPADTSVGGTQNVGVLIYLSQNAGPITLGANSNVTLTGSSTSSAYKGMLFFVDRNTPAQTHRLGGGGNLTLKGTIYSTNTTMTSTLFQTMQVWANSGSGTLIQGEIITSVLQMGGGGSITMQLDPTAILTVNRVALVN